MTSLSRFEDALTNLRNAQEVGDPEQIAQAEVELDKAYESLIAFNQLF